MYTYTFGFDCVCIYIYIYKYICMFKLIRMKLVQNDQSYKISTYDDYLLSNWPITEGTYICELACCWAGLKCPQDTATRHSHKTPTINDSFSGAKHVAGGCLISQKSGGFQSHRGNPSSHPVQSVSPWKKHPLSGSLTVNMETLRVGIQLKPCSVGWPSPQSSPPW